MTFVRCLSPDGRHRPAETLVSRIGLCRLICAALALLAARFISAGHIAGNRRRTRVICAVIALFISGVLNGRCAPSVEIATDAAGLQRDSGRPGGWALTAAGPNGTRVHRTCASHRHIHHNHLVKWCFFFSMQKTVPAVSIHRDSRLRLSHDSYKS